MPQNQVRIDSKAHFSTAIKSAGYITSKVYITVMFVIMESEVLTAVLLTYTSSYALNL